MTVALVDAPDDFAATLGALPDKVTLRAGARGRADLVIWFVRTETKLTRDVARMARFMGDGRLWIAWRKKATREGTGGPAEVMVRAAGLHNGLVDYKICAIDRTWAGLLFARRRSVR